MENSNTFIPSPSFPILSIIKHFNLPSNEAYQYAHDLLLELQEFDEPWEGDLEAAYQKAARVFKDHAGRASYIADLMRIEIYKHRGLTYDQ